MKLWILTWLPQVTVLLFVAAYGACIGSLTNVLVYRMPRGLSVIWPASRCPKCGTRLSWRDNIPIFGWLFLGGRCRYCREPISPEYPIVEAFVAGLFGLFFVLYFMVPDGAQWVGIPWGSIKPEWARNVPSLTWPTFALLLVLLASLAAMTIVDAKTSTIPLVMTWVPAAAAVVAHPLHAAWVGMRAVRLPMVAPGWFWSIPTPAPGDWWWIGASIGGIMGLGVGNALLATGLIRRSFGDYAEWERSVLGPLAPDVVTDPGSGGAPQAEPAGAAEAIETWTQYPHARREMVKELAFLAPCLVMGWLGGMGAVRMAGAATAPLWLMVLAGVLMGYLIGGGLVWAVRIVGSVALGKEAMGLGDVHMMAAVGACLGWIDSTLAFFLAAFVGLFWTVLAAMFSGSLKRAMPYGPYLAVATVLVLLTKPFIEAGLSRLTGGMAAINLP